MESLHCEVQYNAENAAEERKNRPAERTLDTVPFRVPVHLYGHGEQQEKNHQQEGTGDYLEDHGVTSRRGNMVFLPIRLPSLLLEQFYLPQLEGVRRGGHLDPRRSQTERQSDDSRYRIVPCFLSGTDFSRSA